MTAKAATKPKPKAKPKSKAKPKTAPLTGKARQKMLRDRREERGLIRLEYWGTKAEHVKADKIFKGAALLKTEMAKERQGDRDKEKAKS